jgi:hypothetical protein
LKFGIVEKVERAGKAAVPSGSLVARVLAHPGGGEISYHPTGQLCLEVWNAWGAPKRRWKDGRKLLEALIPPAVAGMIRIALAKCADAEKQQADEQARQRRLEERQRLQQAIKAERAKVRALRRIAANWSRAGQIRQFIAAARQAADLHGTLITPGTPFGDWLTWATAQADRLGPPERKPCINH